MEPTPGKPATTLARGRGEAFSGEALLRWLLPRWSYSASHRERSWKGVWVILLPYCAGG